MRCRAPSPVLSIALVACVAFTAAVAVRRAWPAPPQTHDEFSYLLAADTFAHGRLANDRHPMWEHFESFHILQLPSYVSKYPPLQGLILAAGQLLGDPIYGVWVSFAMACGALCWMLRAWVGEAWALAGALIVALHPQMVAIWGTWLWGGAAPMAGGALVYGAIPRLLCRARARDALALGSGASLLALTRPYEGCAACIPALGLLLHGYWSAEDASPRRLFRALSPALAVLLAAASFLAIYNTRATGHPLRLPYVIYDETYAAVPAFLFMGEPAPKTYRHEPFRAFFSRRGFQSLPYHARRSFGGFWRGAAEKFATFFGFFALYAFSLPLLALPWVLGEPRVKFALVSLLLFAAALLVETYEQRHYAAPMVALATFVWVVCMRRCFRWRVGGRPLGPVLVAVALLVGFGEHGARATSLLERRERGPLVARAKLLRQLEARGGKHLVLVRYGPGHNPHTEWVYNAADIDAAPVVWAREMGPERNRALFSYFAGREVWLLTPDDRQASLKRLSRR